MRKLVIPPEALKRHNDTLGMALSGYLDRLASGKSVKWVKQGKHRYQASAPNEKDYWRWVRDEFIAKQILSAKPIVLLKFAKQSIRHFELIGSCSKKGLNRRQKAVRAVLQALFDYASLRGGGVLLPCGDGGRIQWIDKPVEPKKRKSKSYNYRKQQWDKWNGWSLAEFVRLLDVRYCPYCNAETVGVVDANESGDKVSFSAIDHILPKSKSPLLALSLYNLVPACYRCNSQFKHEHDGFDLECWDPIQPLNVLHPYVHNIHMWFRFAYRPTAVKHLFVKPRDIESPLLTMPMIPMKAMAPSKTSQFYFDRVLEYLQEYRLLNSYRDIYATEINEILKMEMICTSAFVETMKSSCHGMTNEDFDLVFRRASLDPREINKHRFAKLIIDLHKQIGTDALLSDPKAKESLDEWEARKAATEKRILRHITQTRGGAGTGPSGGGDF